MADVLGGVKSIEKLLKEALDNIEKLGYFWNLYDTEGKRRLISSFFTGKIYYDGRNYRTDRLNEAVEEICLKNRKLQAKKCRK